MDKIDIVIDPNSGISVEEQKEILTQINGITDKNRQELSGVSGDRNSKITAKKKGFLFPMAVNIAAIIILCAGAFVIISVSNSTDATIRTGNVVYNITERALIEEIRKSTEEQIVKKEAEIALIVSRMSEIDSELLLLHSSNLTLTAEQIAARERLLEMQSDFRDELSVLNDERASILESSRTREARLRAALDERTAAQQRVTGELEAASAELERLTNEHERMTAIDAQFAGGIAAIGDLIQNEQFDRAGQSIKSLRDFINSISNSSRAFQPRRNYYNQVLNIMDELLADVTERSRINSGSAVGLTISSEQTELIARNTQLQETINEMQRTIDSFSSGSSGQARRIVELEGTISALRSSNTTLEQSSAEKDAEIASLQTERTSLQAERASLQMERASLSATVTDMRVTIAAQELDMARMRNQLEQVRQMLGDNTQ